MENNNTNNQKAFTIWLYSVIILILGTTLLIIVNVNIELSGGMVAAPFIVFSILFVFFAIQPIYILIRARKKIKVTIPQKVLAAACILMYIIFVTIAATANHLSKISGYSFRYNRLIGNMMAWGIVLASVFLLIGSILAIDIIARTQAIKYKKIGLFFVVMSSLFAQPIPFLPIFLIFRDIKTTEGGLYHLFLYSSMALNRFIIVACMATLLYINKRER